MRINGIPSLRVALRQDHGDFIMILINKQVTKYVNSYDINGADWVCGISYQAPRMRRGNPSQY